MTVDIIRYTTTSKSGQVVLELKAKKQTDKLRDNFLKISTCSIVFIGMLLNQEKGRQESIVVSQLKSTAYRNKYLKLDFESVY